jgi:hypothetical protein
MSLPEGYVEYQRREYCKAVECPVQKELELAEEGSSRYEEIRFRCKTACIHTTHEFHSWLNSQGYMIIRSE